MKVLVEVAAVVYGISYGISQFLKRLGIFFWSRVELVLICIGAALARFYFH
jgi:hypothetical protein